MLFVLRRAIKGTKGDSLFTNCVSELVLESRNFDLLLGRLEPDGSRTPGILNHFKGTQVYCLLYMDSYLLVWLQSNSIYSACLLTRLTYKK